MKDSMNFSQLLCTPTCTKAKFNRTYTKSQRRKTFSFQTSIKEDKVYQNNLDELKSGIGSAEAVWETYKLNALYDFSYKRSKLYEYQMTFAKKIKEAILECEIAEYYSVQISVQFEKFPDLAVNERDSPALKVTVCVLDISEEITEIFNGFLLSVDRNEGIMEKQRLEVDAVVLPLILVEYGHKIFLKSFIDFLEENFSCIVSPLNFSSTDLQWMLTLFSSPLEEKLGISTTLEYETPVEELKYIDYTIDEESMNRVWNRVMKQGTTEITEDHVKEFCGILEKHFFDIFRIHLSRLQLRVFKTPICQVEGGSSHCIKILESSKLYFVLKYLTHLAQELPK